jgi:hypothetical protein
MNYPNPQFQPQQFAPAPQQQYAPQPQGAYLPPQQPQQFAPAPPLGQAAAGNLFNQFLSEPPRKRANRAKPADGTYIVKFTANCKLDFSQKDGRPYAILEYSVVEGTVPQMQGQVFTLPMFWSNRMQLQDLADIAKYTFGQQLPAAQQQANGDPARMAQFIAQTLAQGYYAGIKMVRSAKQVQSVGYENAFVNHNFIVITSPQQPITLAQLNVQPQAPQQPAFTPQALPGQATMPQPQQQQGFLPAPAPAMYQPQPMAPQQPQQFAPQQPAFPQAPQQQQFPQAPAFPQVPPQQPTPAHFVPGGQPPR